MKYFSLILIVLLSLPAIAATPAPASQGDFNFKDADLDVVAAEITKRMGKTFIIDSGARGKITISGPGIQNNDDAYHAFLIGLALNGLTVIDEGKFTRIVQAQNSQRSNIPVSYDVPDTDEEKIVTVIYLLKNTNARDIYNELGPILQSRIGEMRVLEDKNMLILSDYTSNAKRVRKIIDAAEARVVAKFPASKYATANRWNSKNNKGTAPKEVNSEASKGDSGRGAQKPAQ